MTNTDAPVTLAQLGWKPFFQQQLTLEEWETATVGRVISQKRAAITVQTEQERKTLQLTKVMPEFAVGDWILLNPEGLFLRLLERFSLFSRKAAGEIAYTQLIAANIDTLFIVTSMNRDFNLNRIERYLALAHDTGVEPVIVLTKADICDTPEPYQEQLKTIDPYLQSTMVNCLDRGSVVHLNEWCVEGRTVALLGSSGVGKSTLVNTLLGEGIQSTSGIREADAKGRHTTTSRSIHLLPSGGLLLDTPGMRELQLSDCEYGVEETFTEITALTEQCRFHDCRHESEPGCALKAAVGSGELDERRLSNYLKLMREQELNTATIAERRAKDRDFGKMVRSAIKSKANKRKR